MRVFCNGFNLYGQLKVADNRLLQTFTKTFEESFSIIEINYSYTLLQINNRLVLYNGKNIVETVDLSQCGEVIQISSNDERILVLNSKGKIFKVEVNDHNKIVEIPSLITFDKITRISCGAKINVAYSNDGKLFNIPNKLNCEIPNLIDIKTGREHCALLDRIGNVYTFGRGSRGQLGNGCLDDALEPTLVEALAGIKIIEIAAGAWHCCAISKDGDLYTWGWNGNGQLGIKKSSEESCVSVMATPRVVDFENPERNAVKIACGRRHTIVLLDDGTVHGCGWNKYKQLKNESTEAYYEFTPITNGVEEVILDVKCGPWNSVLLCK